MNGLKPSISGLRVKSTFVAFLQVVANMQEGGSLESGTESSNLCVSSDKTSEPVVADTDGRNDLTLAAVLEATLSKDGHLSASVGSSKISVRSRPDLCVVQKDNLNVANDTFMDSKSVFVVTSDRNVVNIVDASRVLSQVAGLTLSVSLVVWRNNDDFFSEFGKSKSKFVNHDTEATDSGPTTKLWSHKHNGSKLVCLIHELACSGRGSNTAVRR